MNSVSLRSSSQRFRTVQVFLLSAYSAVLFLLHFVRIFDNSFWGDESYSIQLVKMNFFKMCLTTAKDVHPPLYYFFTQILYFFLGDHGYTYHLSAVLPYGIILILACTIIRKWFGMIPSAIVVTLSSLTSNALIYNVEARMYALGALWVLASYLAFYQIYNSNRPCDWFAFGFFSLCAAYTHYYALISVAFFYLMLLPLWKKGSEFRKRILRLYSITVLSYIVWLYVLIKSFMRTSDGWWLDDTATLLECFDFIWGFKWLSVVALIFFIYKTITSLSLFLSHKETYFSNESILFFAGLLSIIGTTFIGLILSHLIRPFMVPRYLFPLTPVAYLMLGLCIKEVHWKKPLTVLLLILVLLWGIPQWLHTYQHELALNAGTEQVLHCVTPSQDAFIYTNDTAIGWSLMGYYFPNIAYDHANTVDEIISSSSSEIWCLWIATPFTTSDLSAFSQHHFSCEEVYQGLFMKDTFTGRFFTDANDQIFHIYKITKNTEAQQ